MTRLNPLDLTLQFSDRGARSPGTMEVAGDDLPRLSPDSLCLGGASLNFGVRALRLCLYPIPISALGPDEPGEGAVFRIPRPAARDDLCLSSAELPVPGATERHRDSAVRGPSPSTRQGRAALPQLLARPASGGEHRGWGALPKGGKRAEVEAFLAAIAP